MIGALRGRTGKFPGNCAQKAASKAKSSRATSMPVSARKLRAKRNVIVEWLQARLARRIGAGFRDIGQYLQGEMMIAHDELVAGERVQRILEFGCLRNGEIAGIRHPVDIGVAAGIGPCALVRNVNDCVSTKANGADNSRLYIPTTLGVGYSLMPSMAPTRVRWACGIRWLRYRKTDAWLRALD